MIPDLMDIMARGALHGGCLRCRDAGCLAPVLRPNGRLLFADIRCGVRHEGEADPDGCLANEVKTLSQRPANLWLLRPVVSRRARHCSRFSELPLVQNEHPRRSRLIGRSLPASPLPNKSRLRARRETRGRIQSVTCVVVTGYDVVAAKVMPKVPTAPTDIRFGQRYAGSPPDSF